MEYPKFKVSKFEIEKLFEPGKLFDGSNKSQILQKGATFYKTKSEDGRFLLLVQVVNEKHTTLSSLINWCNKPVNETTNPWLEIKKFEIMRIEESKPEIHPKKIHFGMNQWKQPFALI